MSGPEQEGSREGAARIAAAQRLLREGRREEALAACRELLEVQAGDARVWHLCAIAEHQLGRVAQARESARRALEIDASQSAYHLIAGHAAADDSDAAAAAGHYARAVALRPDWAAAWHSLGVARFDSGDSGAAREAFERALKLDARLARTWNNLGLAELALDRVSQAEAAFARAIEAEPGYVLAHYNLARVAERSGRFEEALSRLATAIGLAPRLKEALLLRARLMRRRRDPGAEAAHRAALEVAPDDSAVRAAWADFLWELGRADEARAEFQRAESSDRSSLRAALGARLSLPAVYSGAEHLEECRARYTRGLEELHAVADRFLGRKPAETLAEASWTNFYLAYQGRDDRLLQSRYGDLLPRVLQPALPRYFAERPPRPGAHKLRVGFFSHFFFNCTVGRYFASWILDLDRTRFEPVVFYTNWWMAHDTRAIAAAADRFFHVAGRPLFEVAQLMDAQDLDVLVYPELGMHADTFALAALRLAPVQVAGWGHPTTSGLASIDAYLSCAPMELPEAQEAYRERLVLLPGLGTRYARPATTSRKSREELGLPRSGTLYLCPQSLFKIHPDNDSLLADVLAGDPDGRLVFFSYRAGPVFAAFRDRLFASLKAAGIDGTERTVFLDYLTHDDYLRVNQLCDVMLDTLHWSGGNTSLDAIASGLPLVTLPGTLMRGRQSAAMLRQLGLSELVAKDRDEYVRLALDLGRNADRRRGIQATIGERAGALFEDRAPTAAFAQALVALAGRGD